MNIAPDDLIKYAQELSTPQDPALFSPKQYFMRSQASQNAIDKILDKDYSTCFLFFHESFRKSFREKMGLKLSKANPLKGYKFEIYEVRGKQVALALLPEGAPAAVRTLEEIQVLGFDKFISIGICGGLQDDCAIGDILLIDQAVRDEGTSMHYQAPSVFSYPHFGFTEFLNNTMTKSELGHKFGLCWTTDAPYRETKKKIAYWKKKITLGVEMECSALFSLAKFRGFAISSVLIVSDVLNQETWDPQFSSSSISSSLDQVIHFFSSNLDQIIDFES
ncbi:MAG: nucleoside phosphorylase [Candidatus Cloacimonetes bacterium]|nr:nucleoside phosphorylase [Candidatus Cloacimonadota bacterium]